VAGLVRAAMELLGEAGHPATDATRSRVAATLHAASASPEAAELVRGGRLSADLDPSGFGAATEDGDRAAAAGEDDPVARRAARAVAMAARDDARKRARLAADQAVLATRHAERLGRLADQAEREADRARAAASAAIEAASTARERATRAAKEFREAEDRVPAEH
jgi:hypothetical protein